MTYSICKIFAYDTSIFSKVLERTLNLKYFKSQRDLNKYLSIISEGAFQWKMQFNSDPNKQANEVSFSRKPNTNYYIPIKLNVFLLNYSYYSAG